MTDPVKLDVEAAKSAGFTDAEIAEFLASKFNEGEQTFDLEGARASGRDDGQIINFLTTGQEPIDQGPLEAFGRVGATGLATAIPALADVPADIARSAVGFAEEKGIIPKSGADLFRLVAGEEPVLTEAAERGLEATGFEPITREQIPALPRTSRIAARAGDVVGSSIPFALAPFGVNALTVRGNAAKARSILRAPGIGGDILRNALKNPKAFALAETTGITGAGLGAALSETFDPSDDGTRLFAEVAGGFLAPLNVLRLLPQGRAKMFSIIGQFTQRGRRDRAAAIVQDILAVTGEDPAAVARILNASGIGTSGQRTGSPALIALEQRLAKGTSQKARDFAQSAEAGRVNNLAEFRRQIDAIEALGDPQAVEVAARLRQQYFDEVLNQTLEQASREALDARAAINTQDKLGDISKRTTNIIEDALGEARRVETTLWDKIPIQTEVGTANLAQEFASVRARLLPEETLDSVAERAIQRITKNETVTIGETQQLRKRLRARARDAKAKGNLDEARQLNRLGAAVLEDYLSLSDDVTAEARAFSAQLNDKFTRTFAGQALETIGTGARRISPEEILETAFGGRGTGRDVRFGQLQEAAEFGGLGPAMANRQEQFLAAAAREVLDPETGRVNPRQLAGFLKKNADVLEQFPALRARLQTAEDAERAFVSAERAAVSSKQQAQREVFSLVTQFDDPVRAVSTILTGKQPLRGYKQLAEIAKEGNAVDGLRTATLDSVIQRATDASGNFTFARFNRLLFGPTLGRQSLISQMRTGGIIDRKLAGRLQVATKKALEFEDALQAGRDLEKVVDDPSALTDLVIRIVGANVGGAGAVGSSTGTPLIAAAAGARFARNIFEKVPATRINDVLIEASENPQLMALLLERPKGIKRATEVRKQINAFLIGAGITSE